MDIPAWNRQLLVRGPIAIGRSPRTSEEYQLLWTPEGSPLILYGYEVRDLLQQRLGNQYLVSLAMRYQSPSIASALYHFREQGLKNWIIIPLFPQQDSATVDAALETEMYDTEKERVFHQNTMITKH